MSYTELSIEERVTIQIGQYRDLSQREIARLLGLASEQALAQQRVFLFKKTDPRLHLRKHLLEKLKIVGEVFGHKIVG